MLCVKDVIHKTLRARVAVLGQVPSVRNKPTSCYMYSLISNNGEKTHTFSKICKNQEFASLHTLRTGQFNPAWISSSVNSRRPCRLRGKNLFQIAILNLVIIHFHGDFFGSFLFFSRLIAVFSCIVFSTHSFTCCCITPNSGFPVIVTDDVCESSENCIWKLQVFQFFLLVNPAGHSGRGKF